MLQTIGAILIVVGFIFGVYCGVLLSLKSVVVSDTNQVKQGKLAVITGMCVVSVVLVFIGQLLWFNFGC
jgi:hypothetical protein